MSKQVNDVQNGAAANVNEKPPYVSYKTFNNLLETLKANKVPQHIDKSIMPSMSGTNRTLVISTLKYLGLIDQDGQTREELHRLVNSEGEERKNLLRDILRKSYPELFEDDFIQSATQQKFHEKFTGYGMTGSTIAKAEIFFIQAAKEAELDISSYIKATRKPGRSPGAQRKPSNEKPDITKEHASKENKNKGDDPLDMSLKRMITEKMLEKFPPFNPEWSKEAQEDWLKAIREFHATIKD